MFCLLNNSTYTCVCVWTVLHILQSRVNITETEKVMKCEGTLWCDISLHGNIWAAQRMRQSRQMKRLLYFIFYFFSYFMLVESHFHDFNNVQNYIQTSKDIWLKVWAGNHFSFIIFKWWIMNGKNNIFVTNKR